MESPGIPAGERRDWSEMSSRDGAERGGKLQDEGGSTLLEAFEVAYSDTNIKESMADPEPRDSAGRNRGFCGKRVDVSGRLGLKLGLARLVGPLEYYKFTDS